MNDQTYFKNNNVAHWSYNKIIKNSRKYCPQIILLTVNA